MMRARPPSSLVLGADHGDGVTRLGAQLPLCDNIQTVTSRGASLRTPLLEDDRESCV